MIRPARTFVFILAVLTAGVSSTAQKPESGPNGNAAGAALVAKVLRYKHTTGFRILASMTVDRAEDAVSRTANLRILGRRSGSATDVLYQVTWPQSARGYALVVTRSDRSPDSRGFLLEPPDRVTPLTSGLAARPYFGSDLLIEDLVEAFWDWPSQRVVGEERVNGRACLVLESRPPADAPSAYSLIRSWVDKARPVPVRMEKLGRDGRAARRLLFVPANRRGSDGGVPAQLVADVPGARSRTTVEFFSNERDISVSAQEFSVEQLKRAATGRH